MFVVERNLYEVLGIGKEASEDEIRKAFRKIASENHPDKNPGDLDKENIFKEANSAYQILGDREKKFKYDMDQSKIESMNNRGNPINDIFSNVWPDAFKESREGTKRRQKSYDNTSQDTVGTYGRGDDISIDVKLTLAEAIYGCKKKIHIKSPRPSAQCRSCLGSGAEPGTRRDTCNSCSGSGRSIAFGVMGTRTVVCMICRGKGSISLKLCRPCNGYGKIIHEEDILVTVPAGVDSGQQLRLAGKGSPGSPPGDLYLNIAIGKHELYTRHSRDLHTEINISLLTAIRGGIASYVYVDGTEKICQIPPGTQSGSVLVERRHGITSHMSGNSGDLYIKTQVVIPSKLSPRAAKLMEELAEELEE